MEITSKLRRFFGAIVAASLMAAPLIAQDGVDTDVDQSKDGWAHAPRFGWYYPLSGGWIWHGEHGYMFEVKAGPRQAYIWTASQGWWYVNTVIFPWVYDIDTADWIYYGGTFWNHRWFYRAAKADWITDEQKENLRALHDLLATIREGSEVTEELVQAYKDAMRSLVDNSTGPSQETLDALAELKALVMEDGVVTDEEKEALKTAYAAVIESIEVVEEDADAVSAAWQALVDASNISEEQKAELRALIDAIVAEYKENHPDYNGDGRPDRPQPGHPRPGPRPPAPGREFFKDVLDMRSAIIATLRPLARPEHVEVNRFISNARNVFALGVEPDELPVLTAAIVELREGVVMTDEELLAVRSAVEVFASERVSDAALLAEVMAAIDAGFTAELPPVSAPVE